VESDGLANCRCITADSFRASGYVGSGPTAAVEIKFKLTETSHDEPTLKA
jgi:hypothetical protein